MKLENLQSNNQSGAGEINNDLVRKSNPAATPVPSTLSDNLKNIKNAHVIPSTDENFMDPGLDNIKKARANDKQNNLSQKRKSPIAENTLISSVSPMKKISLAPHDSDSKKLDSKEIVSSIYSPNATSLSFNTLSENQKNILESTLRELSGNKQLSNESEGILSEIIQTMPEFSEYLLIIENPDNVAAKEIRLSSKHNYTKVLHIKKDKTGCTLLTADNKLIKLGNSIDDIYKAILLSVSESSRTKISSSPKGSEIDTHVKALKEKVIQHIYNSPNRVLYSLLAKSPYDTVTKKNIPDLSFQCDEPSLLRVRHDALARDRKEYFTLKENQDFASKLISKKEIQNNDQSNNAEVEEYAKCYKQLNKTMKAAYTNSPTFRRLFNYAFDTGLDKWSLVVDEKFSTTQAEKHSGRRIISMNMRSGIDNKDEIYITADGRKLFNSRRSIVNQLVSALTGLTHEESGHSRGPIIEYSNIILKEMGDATSPQIAGKAETVKDMITEDSRSDIKQELSMDVATEVSSGIPIKKRSSLADHNSSQESVRKKNKPSVKKSTEAKFPLSVKPGTNLDTGLTLEEFKEIENYNAARLQSLSEIHPVLASNVETELLDKGFLLTRVKNSPTDTLFVTLHSSFNQTVSDNSRLKTDEDEITTKIPEDMELNFLSPHGYNLMIAIPEKQDEYVSAEEDIMSMEGKTISIYSRLASANSMRDNIQYSEFTDDTAGTSEEGKVINYTCKPDILSGRTVASISVIRNRVRGENFMDMLTLESQLDSSGKEKNINTFKDLLSVIQYSHPEYKKIIFATCRGSSGKTDKYYTYPTEHSIDIQIPVLPKNVDELSNAALVNQLNHTKPTLDSISDPAMAANYVAEEVRKSGQWTTLCERVVPYALMRMPAFKDTQLNLYRPSEIRGKYKAYSRISVNKSGESKHYINLARTDDGRYSVINPVYKPIEMLNKNDSFYAAIIDAMTKEQWESIIMGNGSEAEILDLRHRVADTILRDKDLINLISNANYEVINKSKVPVKAESREKAQAQAQAQVQAQAQAQTQAQAQAQATLPAKVSTGPSQNIAFAKRFSTEIRKMGEFRNQHAEILPQIIYHLPELANIKFQITVKSDIPGQSYKIGASNEDSSRNVTAKLILSGQHYWAVSADGREIEVPADGDCFYHAVLASLPPAVRQTVVGQASGTESVRILRNKIADHVLKHPEIVDGFVVSTSAYERDRQFYEEKEKKLRSLDVQTHAQNKAEKKHVSTLEKPPATTSNVETLLSDEAILDHYMLGISASKIIINNAQTVLDNYIPEEHPEVTAIIKMLTGLPEDEIEEYAEGLLKDFEKLHAAVSDTITDTPSIRTKQEIKSGKSYTARELDRAFIVSSGPEKKSIINRNVFTEITKCKNFNEHHIACIIMQEMSYATLGTRDNAYRKVTPDGDYSLMQLSTLASKNSDKAIKNADTVIMLAKLLSDYECGVPEVREKIKMMTEAARQGKKDIVYDMTLPQKEESQSSLLKIIQPGMSDSATSLLSVKSDIDIQCVQRSERNNKSAVMKGSFRSGEEHDNILSASLKNVDTTSISPAIIPGQDNDNSTLIPSSINQVDKNEFENKVYLERLDNHLNSACAHLEDLDLQNLTHSDIERIFENKLLTRPITNEENVTVENEMPAKKSTKKEYVSAQQWGDNVLNDWRLGLKHIEKAVKTKDESAFNDACHIFVNDNFDFNYFSKLPKGTKAFYFATLEYLISNNLASRPFIQKVLQLLIGAGLDKENNSNILAKIVFPASGNPHFADNIWYPTLWRILVTCGKKLDPVSGVSKIIETLLTHKYKSSFVGLPAIFLSYNRSMNFYRATLGDRKYLRDYYAVPSLLLPSYRQMMDSNKSSAFIKMINSYRPHAYELNSNLAATLPELDRMQDLVGGEEPVLEKYRDRATLYPTAEAILLPIKIVDQLIRSLIENQSASSIFDKDKRPGSQRISQQFTRAIECDKQAGSNLFALFLKSLLASVSQHTSNSPLIKSIASFIQRNDDSFLSTLHEVISIDSDIFYLYLALLNSIYEKAGDKNIKKMIKKCIKDFHVEEKNLSIGQRKIFMERLARHKKETFLGQNDQLAQLDAIAEKANENLTKRLDNQVKKNETLKEFNDNAHKLNGIIGAFGMIVPETAHELLSCDSNAEENELTIALDLYRIMSETLEQVDEQYEIYENNKFDNWKRLNLLNGIEECNHLLEELKKKSHESFSGQFGLSYDTQRKNIESKMIRLQSELERLNKNVVNYESQEFNDLANCIYTFSEDNYLLLRGIKKTLLELESSRRSKLNEIVILQKKSKVTDSTNSFEDLNKLNSQLVKINNQISAQKEKEQYYLKHPYVAYDSKLQKVVDELHKLNADNIKLKLQRDEAQAKIKSNISTYEKENVCVLINALQDKYIATLSEIKELKKKEDIIRQQHILKIKESFFTSFQKERMVEGEKKYATDTHIKWLRENADKYKKEIERLTSKRNETYSKSVPKMLPAQALLIDSELEELDLKISQARLSLSLKNREFEQYKKKNYPNEIFSLYDDFTKPIASPLKIRRDKLKGEVKVLEDELNKHIILKLTTSAKIKEIQRILQGKIGENNLSIVQSRHLEFHSVLSNADFYIKATERRLEAVKKRLAEVDMSVDKESGQGILFFSKEITHSLANKLSYEYISYNVPVINSVRLNDEIKAHMAQPVLQKKCNDAIKKSYSYGALDKSKLRSNLETVIRSHIMSGKYYIDIMDDISMCLKTHSTDHHDYSKLSKDTKPIWLNNYISGIVSSYVNAVYASSVAQNEKFKAETATNLVAMNEDARRLYEQHKQKELSKSSPPISDAGQKVKIKSSFVGEFFRPSTLTEENTREVQRTLKAQESRRESDHGRSASEKNSSDSAADTIKVSSLPDSIDVETDGNSEALPDPGVLLSTDSNDNKTSELEKAATNSKSVTVQHADLPAVSELDKLPTSKPEDINNVDQNKVFYSSSESESALLSELVRSDDQGINSAIDSHQHVQGLIPELNEDIFTHALEIFESEGLHIFLSSIENAEQDFFDQLLGTEDVREKLLAIPEELNDHEKTQVPLLAGKLETSFEMSNTQFPGIQPPAPNVADVADKLPKIMDTFKNTGAVGGNESKVEGPETKDQISLLDKAAQFKKTGWSEKIDSYLEQLQESSDISKFSDYQEKNVPQLMNELEVYDGKPELLKQKKNDEKKVVSNNVNKKIPDEKYKDFDYRLLNLPGKAEKHALPHHNFSASTSRINTTNPNKLLLPDVPHDKPGMRALSEQSSRLSAADKINEYIKNMPDTAGENTSILPEHTLSQPLEINDRNLSALMPEPPRNEPISFLEEIEKNIDTSLREDFIDRYIKNLPATNPQDVKSFTALDASHVQLKLPDVPKDRVDRFDYMAKIKDKVIDNVNKELAIFMHQEVDNIRKQFNFIPLLERMEDMTKKDTITRLKLLENDIKKVAGTTSITDEKIFNLLASLPIDKAESIPKEHSITSSIYESRYVYLDKKVRQVFIDNIKSGLFKPDLDMSPTRFNIATNNMNDAKKTLEVLMKKRVITYLEKSIK